MGCCTFLRERNEALLLFDDFRPCSLKDTLTPSPEYSEAKL